MKDNQHKQLFTELTAKFEATAFKELDDEVAATCIGGAAVILYENGNFNKGNPGRKLEVNGSLKNLGSFNDLTSSFIIKEGRWEFYADENFKKRLFTYTPGEYPVIADRNNDRVSSIKRIG